MTEQEKDTLDDMMELYLRMTIGIWARYNPNTLNMHTYFCMDGRKYKVSIERESSDADSD